MYLMSNIIFKTPSHVDSNRLYSLVVVMKRTCNIPSTTFCSDILKFYGTFTDHAIAMQLS